MKVPSFLDKFMDDKLDLDKEVITGLVCGCSIMFGTTVNAFFSYMLNVSNGIQEFSLISLILLAASTVLTFAGMVLSLKIIMIRMEIKDKEETQESEERRISRLLKKYYDAHPEEKEWAIKKGLWHDDEP